MTATEVPWSEIDRAIGENRMIEAIRIYRLATNAGLAAAIALLQTRQAMLGGAAPTPTADLPAAPDVATALDAAALDLLHHFEHSAFCPPGARLAAWRNRAGELCTLHWRDANILELNIVPANAQFGHDLHGYRLSTADLLQRLRASEALPMAEFADGSALGVHLLRQLSPTGVPAARSGLQSARASLFALNAARFEAQFAFRGPVWSAAAWRSVLNRASKHADLLGERAMTPAEAVTEPSMLLDMAQSRLVLALCLVECGSGRYALNHEAQFRDWARVDYRRIPLPLQDAWSVFVSWLDVEGQRRPALPGWLDQATRQRDTVGLAMPAQVRFLAAQWQDLCAHLDARPDHAGIASLLADAAGRGDYLLAIAPMS